MSGSTTLEPTLKHNFPLPLTSFIGREQEVAAVCTLLQQPEVRLLTLTGPGGVGKTRLGLQVATMLLDDFADGVCFVTLSPISDPMLVVPTIAQMFGLTETGAQPVLDLLQASLGAKHLLLGLDNFEQVAEAAPHLSELAAGCPHLKILVTSRAVLHIRGEQEYVVPPLALPDLTHLPDSQALMHYAAIDLFLQRARSARPDFQVTPTNARSITEICIRLDGLPLAIELAAARIKLLPPNALLARLGQRLAVLASETRDVPARQQTLRKTLEWSYNLLETEEQKLFRRLCVFAGGCTLEAIEYVCSAIDDGALQVLDDVASLIDKSLLAQTAQDAEEPRLMMLETIREYGMERLVTSGEAERTQRAHALYYLKLAEEADTELGGPRQVTWLERLEREHDNLRAATRWALEQGETGYGMDMALRFGGALRRFWVRHGYHSEGRNCLEWALSRREGVAAPVLTRALMAAARIAAGQGEYDSAEKLCEEGLALCREHGDKASAAFLLYLLGWVAEERGNYQAALAFQEESLALYREIGDKENIAYELDETSRLYSKQGDFAKARALVEESLEVHRELENKWGVAISLYNLADLLFNSQGDLTMAHRLNEESLSLNRTMGDQAGVADNLYLAGRLVLHQGNIDAARTLLEECVVLNRDMGHQSDTAKVLSLLARADVLQGNYEAAHALYEESLKLCKKIGYQAVIASCLEGLASLRMAQGPVEAGPPHGMPLQAGTLGAAMLWGAAEVLREATGAPIPPVERAAYEQVVAAARAQLGEGAFARAWARGRTMTLEQVIVEQKSEIQSEQIPIVPQAASTKKAIPAFPDGLTIREVEVLRLVAQGLTDAQVAQNLVVSRRTVNWHLTSIYSKIRVSSRSAATRYAIEQKLI